MSRLMRVLIASVIFAGAVSVAEAEAERGLKDGEVLPPREVKLADGATTALPAQEGLTVLVFWSTWSPRSRPALELWQKYQDEYAKHKVRVIAVNAERQNMSSEDIAKVEAFLRESGVTFPNHTELNLDLFNEIGVIVLPTAVFLKNDGTILARYTSLPSSAALDIKETLDKLLGLAKEPEVKAAEEKPAYQPQNNAMMYFGLGKQLHQKGQKDKAEVRYIEALKRDPEYPDPLRGLEGIYFADGRTAETEGKLKDLLKTNGLENLIERIGQGEPLKFEDAGKSDMMEKMKRMMQGAPPAQ